MSAEREPALRPIGGRYWPVRLLAVGGMAEIYLARQGAPGPGQGIVRGGAGRAGFDKELVVKRLKPSLAGDPRMVEMFHDEARVSGLLDHPHVVQVYDVGEEDGLPFIVMEFIRGEELNELCRRGLAAGAFLPLEHAVDLVRQAAMALGYVHALRDGEGRGYDVVHCDVSPTNLLVTEDGYLKVIDFGIARSRGQARRDEHAVPGKLSYMSPEQARRQPLDHRSDIFSLGVVLYEISLGQRLFRGPAQEVIRRLAACDVKPPTFVQRDFPGPLESIIMRALEAEPADRYASAYDMAEELEEFLREQGMKSGPLRVARYLDDLAVAVGGERRPELVSEREEEAGEAEALDFDRGLFEGYRAASPERVARVAEWDEVEEDEQAVADALGVDVRLIKVAATAAQARTEGGSLGTSRPGDESASDAPEPAPTPTATDTVPGTVPATGTGAGTGTAHGPRPTVTGTGILLGIAIGVLLGIAAMALLGFLTG